MAGKEQNNPIKVTIAEGNSSATLIIPSDYPVDATTEVMCHATLTQHEVELTDAAIKAVKKLLESPAKEGEPRVGVVASAIPPVKAIDGRVEWLLPKDQTEETEGQEDGEQEGTAEPQSYYDRSAYTTINANDVIARIIEPVPGQDGRDVCGRTLACKEGRPANLKWDETILRNSKGELIATQDGVLVRTENRITIQKKIEVDGYVDFSTGNIEFTGDLVVAKGIRDRFEVNVDGDVTVHGLIEAATVRCRGDLDAAGGMAGREQGHLHVGGNVTGKYLDNIEGHIEGDLAINREVINAELTIEGNIVMPNGSIIGGQITPVGKVHVGTLGSEATVTGKLVLGSVPKLEPFMVTLNQLAEQLDAITAKLGEEQRVLAMGGTRLSTEEKERQTEIMFELATSSDALAKAARAQDTLSKTIEAKRTVDVNVERVLHAGTILSFNDRAYRVHTDIKGPLRIQRDRRGEVTVERNGHHTPLTQFAKSELPSKSAA